jgi:hypothetical protein
MSEMTFDQRLAAPVRVTAMGIWRTFVDGPRVATTTLRQMQPQLRTIG